MAYLNSRPQTPKVCPVCGEDVPSRALACPECGADHNSGWKEDYLDGADLPDNAFDYDKFIQEEFGRKVAPSGINRLWWITGVILLLALIALAFYGGF